MQNQPNNELSKTELFKQISAQKTKIVLDKNNNPVEHTLRIPTHDERGIIDALNFVIDAETVYNDLYEELESDRHTDETKREIATATAQQLATVLSYIMGQDFETIQDTGVSRNRYKYTYMIGEIDNPLGMIGIRNHNKESETILVMIYGTGCHYADDFWEFSLHSWLTCKAVNPKITRVDIALDDFEGKYSSAEQVDQADSDEKFAITNKIPNVEHLGNWKRPNGNGRTINIGSRISGKLYRGYEKGRQLGDKDSLWFRHEVELSNKGRFLPIDVLVFPTDTLAGTYPYVYELLTEMIADQKQRSNMTVIKIKTIKKSSSISLAKAVEVTKHQFGKYLKVFREIFQDDTQILDALVSDQEYDYYPKRLKIIEKFKYNPPSYYRVSNDKGEITEYTEIKTKHVKSNKVKIHALVQNWHFLSSIKPTNNRWSTS